MYQFNYTLSTLLLCCNFYDVRHRMQPKSHYCLTLRTFFEVLVQYMLLWVKICTIKVKQSSFLNTLRVLAFIWLRRMYMWASVPSLALSEQARGTAVNPWYKNHFIHGLLLLWCSSQLVTEVLEKVCASQKFHCTSQSFQHLTCSFTK